MSVRLRLQQFQIALLGLKVANMDPEAVHIPGYVRRGQSSIGVGGYVERARARKKREREWLLKRIAYLKRQHYIEQVQEGEQRLYKLTAKGQYEILRMRLATQLQQERQKKGNRKMWLLMSDIPEAMRKYRNVIRALLKQHGFTMLQQSIWVTRYNPRPVIDELLKYLGLGKYFEILEVDCSQCSARFRRKVGIWW